MLLEILQRRSVFEFYVNLAWAGKMGGYDRIYGMTAFTTGDINHNCDLVVKPG
jgi:hypothetical protein